MGMCGTMITDVFTVDAQPAARAQLAGSQAMRQHEARLCSQVSERCRQPSSYTVCPAAFRRPLATSWATICLAGGTHEQVRGPPSFALQLHLCYLWPLLQPACLKQTRRFTRPQGTEDPFRLLQRRPLREPVRRARTPRCCLIQSAVC